MACGSAATIRIGLETVVPFTGWFTTREAKAEKEQRRTKNRTLILDIRTLWYGGAVKRQTLVGFVRAFRTTKTLEVCLIPEHPVGHLTSKLEHYQKLGDLLVAHWCIEYFYSGQLSSSPCFPQWMSFGVEDNFLEV